ncbi:nucleotidyl transferase AbiEii/AbiGii toxin family protein [Candidatus Gottesmanbacteria bacterium]|nr:nucleotidyl transferase AbiEii/AbiGii toxin family protein [Candidatus Gottesmanbacteria bacterium]
MTNIVANWKQILEMASGYGLPPEKKRAILREFLQAKIISLIYSQKEAQNLFFVGGTALRLLFGLDRFSEDLDFDAPDLNREKLKKIMATVFRDLQKENIAAEIYKNFTNKKDHFELRFSDALFSMGVSPNKSEKLAVKFDFEKFWRGQTREVVVFNHFGFLAKIVTKPRDQFMVEKLAAYLGRQQIQARDLYDLVWLKSMGAKPDKKFALANGFRVDELVAKSLVKYRREKLSGLRSSLRPFLLNEKSVDKLDFFALLDSGL